MDELQNLSPVLLKSAETASKIQGVRLARGDTRDIRTGLLYIIEDTSLLESFSKNCPLNIIINNANSLPGAIGLECNVVQLNEKMDTQSLYERIQEIIEDFSIWNTSLTVSIINQQSLKNTLEIAALKLKNPIGLFDISQTLIGKAGDFTGNIEGTIWEKVNFFGYSPIDFFSVSEHSYLNKKMEAGEEPFLFTSKTDPSHMQLSAPIRLNSKLFGAIGSIDINCPFTQGQISLVNHIGKLIELALENSHTFLRLNENENYYIENLLGGYMIEERVIEYHLVKKGWRNCDEFFLLNFSCSVSFSIPMYLQVCIKSIQKLFPVSIICLYENSIIVLVRKKEHNIAKQSTQDELIEFVQSNEMNCGISTVFSQFTNLKYYYIQSKFALGICEQQPDRKIVLYENCYWDHVVCCLESAISLKSLCHPKILSLWESNEPAKIELIHCLYAFLLNGKSFSATASMLFIHRNTLSYRLNKISDYLDVDIKSIDSNTLFYLLFSCRIAERL
ncbi:MAG: helix-turn-helix domain-containing protein [Clostridiales bacterium]|nr:helix-turn-helix domain-containing protein [Clostridiales bacterium]